MNEVATLLVETADRLFRDHVTPELLNRAEQGEWPADLWHAIEETGLAQAMREDAGGSLDSAVAVLCAAGRHAVPVPLAETMLAGWLLSACGQEVPEGPLSVAPVRGGDLLTLQTTGADIVRVSGSARRIPWARQVRYLVVVGEAEDGETVALVEAAATHISRAENLAGEPRDDASFDDAEVAAHATGQDIGLEALVQRGALARAALISGALDHVLTATVQYAGERKQFGRAIAKFQAIQHHLASLAGHSAATTAAVNAAAKSADPFDIAVAKARASEAAGEAAAIAHQVHGAIGFTYEHSLHHSTKRLWAWREEFGNEAYWHDSLGKLVAARGADGLWPMITES